MLVRRDHGRGRIERTTCDRPNVHGQCASFIFLGVTMLRALFALWISFVVGAALFAEDASGEAQSKSELLRSLNFQNGTITIGENFAAIAPTDKFVYLDSEDAKTFL